MPGKAHLSDERRGAAWLPSGETTWHGFTQAILEESLARLKKLGCESDWCEKALESLQPIPTSAYRTAAKRPAYSLLSGDKLERVFGAEGEVSHLDGVSVTADDWHFNVRPSNTEPLLRLNLEARSQELMERKRDEVLGVIRS